MSNKIHVFKFINQRKTEKKIHLFDLKLYILFVFTNAIVLYENKWF